MRQAPSRLPAIRPHLVIDESYGPEILCGHCHKPCQYDHKTNRDGVEVHAHSCPPRTVEKLALQTQRRQLRGQTTRDLRRATAHDLIDSPNHAVKTLQSAVPADCGICLKPISPGQRRKVLVHAPSGRATGIEYHMRC